MNRAILVKSCQKNLAKREACEATWVGELRKACPVYFVEAGHEFSSHKGNLIQLAGRDDYDSNSRKVQDAIKFLLHFTAFDMLFICDDDTFVHPGRWLAHEPGGEFEGLQTAEIPWVHGGAGWWMSRRCCELYVTGWRKRCSWDDVLATRILTNLNKIPMVNRPDLYAQWNERVSAENDLITCHQVRPDEMLKLFESTRDLSPAHNLLR